MSSFRAAPRKGHLERAKNLRTSQQIQAFQDSIPSRRTSVTGLPQYTESIPKIFLLMLLRVTLIHYFDANLMHDVLLGKAVIGCLHLANKTPTMWYSKKRATSESATYGSEFVSGRTCVEQVVDLRHSCRYFGVSVNDISYVFGDNESMINSSLFHTISYTSDIIYCPITMLEAW